MNIIILEFLCKSENGGYKIPNPPHTYINPTTPPHFSDVFFSTPNKEGRKKEPSIRHGLRDMTIDIKLIFPKNSAV